MQMPIDFLPASYHARRRRRRVVIRRAALALVMVTLMAGWVVAHRGQIHELARDVAATETELAEARIQHQQLEALRRERGRIVHRVSLNRRFEPAVQQTQVLAVVSGVMPDDMATTHWTARRVGDVDSDDARLELALTGQAPDDLALAELVERLQEHAMFHDVQMRYSRSRQDAPGRAFRVEMQVNLDRRYAPVAAREGVADAH